MFSRKLILDVTKNEKLKQSIFSMEIFKNNGQIVLYPFIYVDKKIKTAIYVRNQDGPIPDKVKKLMDDMSRKGLRTRIVNNVIGLFEKTKLFENGIDDRATDIIKESISQAVPENTSIIYRINAKSEHIISIYIGNIVRELMIDPELYNQIEDHITKINDRPKCTGIHSVEPI